MGNVGDFQVGVYIGGMLNDRTPAHHEPGRLEHQAHEVLTSEAMCYIVPERGRRCHLITRGNSASGPSPIAGTATERHFGDAPTSIFEEP